jgi:PAS domain S-box-containing protein
MSEARYRLLFERSVAGVFAASADGRIRDCNDAFARTFGYAEPAELTGMSLSELLLADERHRMVLERLSAGDVVQNAALVGRKADQSPVRVLLSAGTLRDDAFHDAALHGTVVDDGERHRLEEQLRQAQKVEALGTLAGGIAHDFNNILAAILGHAELAREEANALVRQDIDVILHATGRGKQLVQRILSFSRRQALARRAIELPLIVDEAVAFLRTTLPKSVQLRTKVADDLPTVLADATAVEQVIMNLATNSWHAMPNASGIIEVAVERLYVRDSVARAHPELREGPHVTVAVHDDGAGMDPAVRARAFEPFFTTKGPGAGTGLGLAMVHGIMRQHDGAVEIESEPGRGTTVRCFFPVVASEEPEAEAAGDVALRGNGERILYVEDEPWLCAIGRRMLERLGYQVTTEVDPERAIELLRAHPDAFACIVTDYWMPGLTGVELARAMTRIRPGLAVVMLTGYAADLSDDALADAGIGRVHRKPAPVHELASAIRAVLEAHGRPSGREVLRP